MLSARPKYKYHLNVILVFTCLLGWHSKSSGWDRERLLDKVLDLLLYPSDGNNIPVPMQMHRCISLQVTLIGYNHVVALALIRKQGISCLRIPTLIYTFAYKLSFKSCSRLNIYRREALKEKIYIPEKLTPLSDINSISLFNRN